MGRQSLMFFPLLAAASLASQAVLGSVSAPRDASQQYSNTSLLTWGPSEYTTGPLRAVWMEGYYNNPTATNEEPQPKVKNILTGELYPLKLTDPKTFPKNLTEDPTIFPPVPNAAKLQNIFINQISAIIDSPNITFGGSCGKCKAALEVGQAVALTRPELVPGVLVTLCQKYTPSSSCYGNYAGVTYGGSITQVLANANVSGYDGEMICANFVSGACPAPPPSPINLKSWFKSPKPRNATAPVPRVGGPRLKVLHLSDMHIDPRYEVGSESNCKGAGSLCCRDGIFSPHSPNSVIQPAPLYGAFQCDLPFDLGVAELEAVPVLTGTKEIGFEFSIYTGDLVSHDQPMELSRSYIAYSETIIFDLFKRLLNSGPIYATLGNHDTAPIAQAGPKANGFVNTPSQALADQFDWNYGYVSKLWEYEGWISHLVGNSARKHYGAYSVRRKGGLRIISLNTDLCAYKPNYFAYMNMPDNDLGGGLRFLTDELQAAEDAGERAWIIGHVLSGWDGTNPLPNPTNLFYQIIDRYSPHVVAAIFFGHTHEDQFMIYYANNATSISAANALTVGWIGPSMTPGGNLNTGFRVYEVDAETFDILDAHTWYSDVSTFHSLDGQSQSGPTFQYEYSSREAYGKNIPWPTDAPLNATWWHKVTEQMELNSSLIQTFTTFQGKHSVLSPPCNTTECATAKICYMRSGSAPIAKQNCKTGYGSVQ